MSASTTVAPTPEELAGIDFFAPFARETLTRLLAIGQPIAAAAGTRLFREGDDAEHVYVILAGRISLLLSVPGKPKVAIDTLSGGELVGWSGFLPGHRRVATGRVVLESRLWQWPGAELRSALAADHELGYHMMHAALVAVANRLQTTRMQLLDMFGNDR